MRKFNNDRGNSRFSKRDNFRDRDSNRGSSTFRATCDECGRTCTLPFKPTSGKPVYCSECFQSNKDTENNSFGRRDFSNRNSTRRDFNDRDSRSSGMFHAVCDDCGRDCEVPFKPSPNKEVFCSRCFENKDTITVKHYGKNAEASREFAPKTQPNNDEMKKQMDILNSKLDKILKLLNSHEEKVPVEVKELKVEKSTKATKKAKVKKKAVKKEK
jgi:CxxC-x17-CxxC domain-containing protein